MPTTNDFRNEIMRRMDEAYTVGHSHLEIHAKELHSALGAANLYPSCCNAMMQFYDEKTDEILDAPPSKMSPRLKIRYRLPKQQTLGRRTHAVAEGEPGSHLGGRRADVRRQRPYEERLPLLIEGFETYLDHFERTGVFTGPCVYFHEKTIGLREKLGSAVAALEDDGFIESLYATLTAWGMHRLGTKGPKLKDFADVKKSILTQKERIGRLDNIAIADIAPTDMPSVIQAMCAVITGLNVGANETKLVVGSKALHHLLPALCPPIDGTYTHNFFYGTSVITRNESEVFREIFPLFHKIAVECKETIASRSEKKRGMNSSPTKIIDNAIVGFMKIINMKSKLARFETDRK